MASKFKYINSSSQTVISAEKYVRPLFEKSELEISEHLKQPMKHAIKQTSWRGSLNFIRGKLKSVGVQVNDLKVQKKRTVEKNLERLSHVHVVYITGEDSPELKKLLDPMLVSLDTSNSKTESSLTSGVTESGTETSSNSSRVIDTHFQKKLHYKDGELIYKKMLSNNLSDNGIINKNSYLNHTFEKKIDEDSMYNIFSQQVLVPLIEQVMKDNEHKTKELIDQEIMKEINEFKVLSMAILNESKIIYSNLLNKNITELEKNEDDIQQNSDVPYNSYSIPKIQQNNPLPIPEIQQNSNVTYDLISIPLEQTFLLEEPIPLIQPIPMDQPQSKITIKEISSEDEPKNIKKDKEIKKEIQEAFQQIDNLSFEELMRLIPLVAQRLDRQEIGQVQKRKVFRKIIKILISALSKNQE